MKKVIAKLLCFALVVVMGLALLPHLAVPASAATEPVVILRAKDAINPILDIYVYREQYGREPVVEAIHAGLECGILCGKLPGLDCVSYGPDLKEIHTPRERMSISSVQRVWNYTVEILARMCSAQPQRIIS